MDVLSPLLGHTLVVVAHPDDECVICGALLQRMADPVVAYLTDGAPRDPYFWQRYGSREAYAELRRRETRRALDAVGVRRVEFAADGDERSPATEGQGARSAACEVLVDQELFRVLPAAWRQLARLIEKVRPQALLTLAYEGGHPDHDSCNLLVSVAAAKFGLPAWEAPIYNRARQATPQATPQATAEDMQPQRFAHENGTEVDVHPTAGEIERKTSMWKQYGSQGDFLRFFSPARETVRPLAGYDYSRPPHEGQLNYERWQWPMTGQDVCRAFAGFLNSFASIEPPPSNSGVAADIPSDSPLCR